MNPEPIRRTLGRRGAALLAFGVVWVLSGVNDILDPPKATPGYWLYSHTPWQVQAFGWISTGLVACWAAFRSQGRDAVGWMAVYVMAFYALAVYADAVVEAVGTPHLSAIALSGIRNVALLAVIVICAGWREPVTLDGGERR